MASNENTAGAVRYEVRKDGVVCCASYLPMCGYSPLFIKELQAAGFDFYADGKKVKRSKV